MRQSLWKSGLDSSRRESQASFRGKPGVTTTLLEYGTDALEAHEDAFALGARVLVVDDVLATGGTAEAAASLVRLLGAELIGWSFLLELDFLHGRKRLTGAPVEAISRL